MTELLGRLHPVLVHLPIGILLLAIVFIWLSSRGRVAQYRIATGTTLLLGLISAAAAVVTGLLLRQEGDYEGALIDNHQWMGLAVMFIALLLYILHQRVARNQLLRLVSLLLLAALLITGHLGGSLTHGPDYLNTTLLQETEMETKRTAIADVQAVVAYDSLIHPLLQRKCISCHGASRQKGKLRLDKPEFFYKGGADGPVLDSLKPEAGELLRRILLARDAEDHMPPRGKPDLTEQELNLLHWWISAGASFNKRVGELEQPDAIKPILNAFEQTETEPSISLVPAEPVEAPDTAAVNRLKRLGVVVIPMESGSHYLSINFLPADTISDKDLEALSTLRKQVCLLRLSGQPISDTALGWLEGCTALARLHLDHTRITDAGLVHLKSLHQLQYLNLVGTAVTAAGVTALNKLPALRTVYLFQTGVKAGEWARLQQHFPNTRLDSGGYRVPTLAKDTTDVTKEQKTQ